MGNHTDERLLELAVRVLECEQPHEVWLRIAEELSRALDGAAVLVKAHDWSESSGSVLAWRPDESADRPLEHEGAREARIGFPFAGHYTATADRTPTTAARLVGEQRWRHSRTASVMRQVFGTRHMLGLPLLGEDGTADGGIRGFVVHRAGREFTERDLAYARRAQPLLTASVSRAGVLRKADLYERSATRRVGGGGHGAREVELTAREQAVLHLLAEGLPAQAIARRLAVSVRTVHKHLQNLYRKLGTPDRLSAVLRAQRLGLLPREERVG